MISDWPTKEFVAYALLVVGIPFFLGMLIGSFVGLPVSKVLGTRPIFQRVHLQLLEVINGFAAAVAGIFLFRFSGLSASLTVPAVIAAWISLYCFISRRQIAQWLSWLAGLTVGWLALGL